jgi:GNAT superfamily N-acetyltransferase
VSHPDYWPVQIRSLSSDEIPAVTRSLDGSHAKYFRQRLQYQRAGRGFVLIAWRTGEPKGGLFVMLEPPEERALREELAGVPFLYNAWVRKDSRNRGIGTQLLGAAHERLRQMGYTRLALGVDNANKDAIRLYERIGYDHWDGGFFGIGARANRRTADDERPDRGYDVMVLDLLNHDGTRCGELAGTAGS